MTTAVIRLKFPLLEKRRDLDNTDNPKPYVRRLNLTPHALETMTTATDNSQQHSSTDTNARLTALAFVIAAICAAILAIVAWAIVLPHLRVSVIDYAQTGSAISWFRVLDFARIISVLLFALTAGLVASRTISRHTSPRTGG